MHRSIAYRCKRYGERCIQAGDYAHLGDISGRKVQGFKGLRVKGLKAQDLKFKNTLHISKWFLPKALTINKTVEVFCQQKKLAFSMKLDLYSTCKNKSK